MAFSIDVTPRIYDFHDTEPPVHVRPLIPADAQAVQRILEASWDERYVQTGIMPYWMLASFVRPENSAFVSRQAGRITRALSQQEQGLVTADYYAGVQPADGNGLTGFIKYYLRENSQPLNKPEDRNSSERELYIESFNIDPQSQFRGRGSLLLNAVAAAAERANISHITLDVIMRNVLARMFYYHSGFIGEEPLSAFPGSGKLPSLNRLHQRADTSEVVRRTAARLAMLAQKSSK